jgi:hypothetical protein
MVLHPPKLSRRPLKTTYEAIHVFMTLLLSVKNITASRHLDAVVSYERRARTDGCAATIKIVLG